MDTSWKCFDCTGDMVLGSIWMVVYLVTCRPEKKEVAGSGMAKRQNRPFDYSLGYVSQIIIIFIF